jgi:hypothetical protein
MMSKIVLAFSLFAVTSALPNKIPINKSPRALKVRGGIGPLEATTAAKLAASVTSVNAGMTALSPSKAGEVYGIETTPFLEWIMEGIGLEFVGLALMSWLSISGASTNTAIGCALLPKTVGTLKTILNDLPAKFGMPKGGFYFRLGLNIFFVVTLLTSQDYAPTVTKIAMYWSAFNGILFALSPQTGSRAWGVPSDDKVDFFMKSFGYFLTALAVQGLALADGAEAAKALGYSFLPLLANLIDANFVGKAVDKFGMDKAPQYFWIVLQVVIILSTLV